MGALLGLALTCGCSAALALAPPPELIAFDIPGDDGGKLGLEWPSPPLAPEILATLFAVVETATAPEGPFTEAARFAADRGRRERAAALVGAFGARQRPLNHVAAVNAPRDEHGRPIAIFCRVGITDGSDTVYSPVVSGLPQAEWFKSRRLNNLAVLLAIGGFVVASISASRRNPNLYVRRIAGLEALDEAVGRATEMGKPILYLTGYNDANEISTLASINILSHVARIAAEYDSRLIVPSKWSTAMALCQETVREAYVNSGRPDGYRQEDIFFVAGEQFSYAAAVDGIMVRERPAAIFMLGTFAAESLILAETGASVGAIQIVGTDSTFQIPFFVVCCDYCLIGEELYAASAYLSRDARLLGALRGQDLGKMALAAAMAAGALGLTLVSLGLPEALRWVELFFTPV